MSVLVHRSVRRTLFTMAFPMLAGTFAMNAYNLTDTYFVAQLGTLPLAAMGFTLPAVFLLTFLAAGVGTGVTTLVSHAIGRGDHDGAAKLVSRGLTLVIIVTTLLSVTGYLTMGPLFRLLGAKGETRVLVMQYMGVWFLGSITMSIPMLGNGILISSGDSAAASGCMIFGTLLNVPLDWMMIFGHGGFPPMGMRGAALATIISQAASTALLFYLLGRRRLLLFRRWPIREYLDSFARIARFAVPSILSMMLFPISAAVITFILSRLGDHAVAAAGAAGRIESFAFIVPMALGMSLTPFVSQNFGAGRTDRIREALGLATRFAVVYGVAIAAAFFIAAPGLAAIFTDDPKVHEVLVAYIRIISFGYGMMEVHRYCGFFMTGLHRPVNTTLLNGLRVIVFLIPLSALGAHFGGYRGVFFGRLATDLIVGAVALVWVSRVVRSLPPPAATPPPSAPDPVIVPGDFSAE